jgi:hypothetical protein
MNMIAADGSECGTAPSWCFPFHVIHSVYCRTRDKEWLGKVYPYLKSFINWWFENRTDADGWFHCKCSWESGQDGSKRFLVEGDPGAVSEYVRTVDVESGVAQALAHLAGYAAELGKEDDARKWRELARFRTENVREMFIDGWYRDIDARTGKPIILEDYLDIMMISPVICGVATPEQVAALEPKFIHFKENPHPWLQWPSFMLPYSESGCYAGHRDLVADAIYEVADRTYRRLDARRPWMRQDVTDRPAYRVPGVAYEFWPTDGEVPGGSENYGWGATMPIFIIRSLFGFREDQDFTKRAFEIAPTMPAELLKEGRTYGVTNLTYRGVKFDLNCEVGPSGRLDVTLSYESEEPVELRVVGSDGQESASTVSGASGKIDLSGANGTVYRVEVG